ncbi:hypothetical protein BJ138DRAFT_1121785 [Hygrophoropsis aurantiaca]|uniref:Uncharacterized protein n=1 Tax=Hygrophoropsis aurantiaca TaxID=72124 RepID=A0ACB8ATC6_9AGAM|nr:hypothetical protein BJ138DRAFT_1121785 [Hygrophoropsis aurantiaca]
MGRDSTTTSTSLVPLDYLQASPIRGQLEPHNETSRTGWRFLQCTDTPNQLKVLLPPRTAQYYSQLLKSESSELAKAVDASWDRILEIRRLKDRMIRKCQRLAYAYSASKHGITTPFVTLHAPADFRLKEMEKWIRKQEGGEVVVKKRTSSVDVAPRPSVCCARCANMIPHNHASTSRRSSTHSVNSRRSSTTTERMSHRATAGTTRRSSPRGNSSSSERKPSSQGSPPLPRGNALHESRIQESYSHQSSIQETHQNIVLESATLHESSAQPSSSRETKAQGRRSYDEQNIQDTQYRATRRTIGVIPEDPHENSIEHSVRSHSEVDLAIALSATSPEPLPHPFRGSTSATFQDICESPVDAPELYTREDPSDANALTSSEDDLPNRDGDSPHRPTLPRRRSSLKRNNSDLRMSMNFSAKTVSWAMDRDWSEQMLKYEAAAGEVENADIEWDQMRIKYQEELAGVKTLRRNVTQTLHKLRSETEKLVREDEVLRDQEDKLRAGYEMLEHKHSQYRAKVNAVLHETRHVLTLCGTKREDELHGSS